jgi:hypothetical protein
MGPSAALLAILSVAAPAPAEARPDPCAAARASFPVRVEGVSDDTLQALSTYRAAWKAACESDGPVELDPLLVDAESLSGDVILSRVLDVVTRVLPKNATWPLPGLRRRGRNDFVPDWSAFAAMADRAMAEDQRFWRAAALVADPYGDPAWLGASPGEGEEACVRLGEVPWAEIAGALGQMEMARAEGYVAQGRRLRQRLVETFAALARGLGCGCVRGDAAAGLEPLATPKGERLGSPARRALAKAATDAFEAVRKGRVRWLRDAPGAAPTGCGAKAP